MKNTEITLSYQTKRGAEVIVPVRSFEELAEQIMKLYKRRIYAEAWFNHDRDAIAAQVTKMDGRWTWWYDNGETRNCPTLIPPTT